MRKNAAHERRLIFLAIENISNTPTALKTGRGAIKKEILEYTNILTIPADAALKWLTARGLIYTSRNKRWWVKNPPPDNFCWWHGVSNTIGNTCIKCIREGRT